VRGTPEGLTSVAANAMARDANLATMALPRGVSMVGYPGDELYLNPRARPSIALAPSGGSGSAGDRAAWDIANSVDSEAGYRAYLERFPNGDFSGLARSRLNVAPRGVMCSAS